ncbi:hypothetical protein DBV15_08345 [Temnothorax longispinosus]|uniref:Uncharacterized protein n=1 Tax=Temnothorax longispinosus TaxID=300112 RepID=A0A4V3S7M8_9HYME|nr:hypothetical protein DBV15_08345 [Temnothorax longispinosus]
MDAICSRVIPGKLRGKLLSRSEDGRASRSIDRRLATIEGVVNRLVAHVQRNFWVGNFHAEMHVLQFDLGSKSEKEKRVFFTRNRATRFRGAETSRRRNDCETTSVRQTNVRRIMSTIIRTPTACTCAACNERCR